MIELKTFADLKRAIKVGTRMKVIAHEYRPELIGTIRVVTKAQGNSYRFDVEGDDPKLRNMWSRYAAARCYTFPAPNQYRQDQGKADGKHACWTLEILPERSAT